MPKAGEHFIGLMDLPNVVIEILESIITTEAKMSRVTVFLNFVYIKNTFQFIIQFQPILHGKKCLEKVNPVLNC